jgi:triphosphoribosyl-dephospho-CoA synthase
VRSTGPDGDGTGDRPRTPAENAQLALLLEVASTPKPGNVDRRREYPDLRFEHFLAGAVGARRGLDLAAEGTPVGEAFETAVAGMSREGGGNTQFGCLLLLVPLVAAAKQTDGELSPDDVRAVCEATTVEDAAGFYRAFEHVDVAVEEPPDGMEPLDVRRGVDAVPALRECELTLADVMERSADRDGNARAWTTGFERVFAAADRIEAAGGPVTDHTARAFLQLLAEQEDTFVRIQHDTATAAEVRRRAQACLDGEEEPETLADELVERGINPGTTADITCGALFVALERGAQV